MTGEQELSAREYLYIRRSLSSAAAVDLPPDVIAVGVQLHDKQVKAIGEISATDGGSIVGATTDTYGPNRPNAYVLKLKANGDPLWERIYDAGGPGDEQAFSVRQTSDGGYVIADGNPRFVVLKTNSDGIVSPDCPAGIGELIHSNVQPTFVDPAPGPGGIGDPNFSSNDVNPSTTNTAVSAQDLCPALAPKTVAGASEALPKTPELQSNYPNPFNASTVIAYTLTAGARVKIEIFDILGRRVSTLVDEPQTAGLHQIIWNGTDTNGRALASGVYFYRLSAGGSSQAKKMVLLK